MISSSKNQYSININAETPLKKKCNCLGLGCLKTCISTQTICNNHQQENQKTDGFKTDLFSREEHEGIFNRKIPKEGHNGHVQSDFQNQKETVKPLHFNGNAAHISPVQAIELLANNFLSTLILDVCEEPCLAIPGSKHFKMAPRVYYQQTQFVSDNFNISGELDLTNESPSLTKDNIPLHADAGNGFAQQDIHDSNNAIFNERRDHIHVLVYDKDGFGYSERVVDWLRESYPFLSVQSIKGGIDAFLSEFPLIDRGKMLAVSENNAYNNQMEENLLGSLHGLPGEAPVEQLKAWQKNLIEAVWFGKKNGDHPVPIIDSFLYLSSCYACTRVNLLEYGIQHVVRLGWGFHTEVEPEDNIKFYDYKISDSSSQPIRKVLEEATLVIDEIRRSGGKVLVHCHAGVSRSSTVVLAYLMKFHQLSLYDSWNLTYKARPIIRPNYGFSKALQSYEIDLFDRKEPSLSSFWMSESYLVYLEYVEFMYRLQSQRQFLRKR